MMGMERYIVDEVQRKQLVWYGHTCRMDEERIPNRVLQWTPPGETEERSPQTMLDGRRERGDALQKPKRRR